MFAPQALDQLMHFDARERIERAERLVEQQQLRTVDKRPRERDALPLPARQLRGPVVRAREQPDLVEHRARIVLRAPPEAEHHVLQYGLPRQQARVLIHDPRIEHAAAVSALDERAGARRLEFRNEAQQRRFPAAAAADDRDEAAALDRQIDIGEHGPLAVALAHARQAHRRIAGTAPIVVVIARRTSECAARGERQSMRAAVALEHGGVLRITVGRARLREFGFEIRPRDRAVRGGQRGSSHARPPG